jgi:PAS domain-containing protein
MGKSLASQRPAGIRALESSGDGYWELNLLDGSAWFSDWFAVQLGWSGESRQNSWSALREYLSTSSWARLLRSMRTHLEERTPLDLEVTVPALAHTRAADPQATTRCWRIRGSAQRNSLGQPQYFSGVVQDVTTEQAAREALRGELIELRESFEALPTAVAVIDETGVIQRGNRRWHAAAAALALVDAPLDVGRDYWHGWQRLAPLPDAGVIERLRALLRGAEREFRDVVTIAATAEPRRIGIAACRFDIDGKPQLAVIHDYHA